MGLLVVFIVSLVAGQAIAIFLGLLVERHYSPYAGLVTFIALYFPAHGWGAGWAAAPKSDRRNLTRRRLIQRRVSLRRHLVSRALPVVALRVLCHRFGGPAAAVALHRLRHRHRPASLHAQLLGTNA